MTIEECNALLHKLMLTPTNVPGVYRTVDGDCVSAPNPNDYTFKERAVVFERYRQFIERVS